MKKISNHLPGISIKFSTVDKTINGFSGLNAIDQRIQAEYSLTNNNSCFNFNRRITMAASAAAASPTTATMNSTTTANTIITHSPKTIVPAIKKFSPLYCWATGGCTKKSHAQIVDESFLQRWLDCIRGGGGSSPKTITIKWIRVDQQLIIP